MVIKIHVISIWFIVSLGITVNTKKKSLKITMCFEIESNNKCAESLDACWPKSLIDKNMLLYIYSKEKVPTQFLTSLVAHHYTYTNVTSVYALVTGVTNCISQWYEFKRHIIYIN